MVLDYCSSIQYRGYMNGYFVTFSRSFVLFLNSSSRLLTCQHVKFLFYATIDWPPDRLLQCLINAYCTGTSTGTVPTLFFFCSASSMAASFIRMSDISLARAHIIGLRLSRSAPAHGRYKNPLRSGREALHRFYLRPFFPSSF